VIAMTNLPEAELTREAEVAFATMAVITDLPRFNASHNART